MLFYTYLHCKPDGTPFYVGKGHGKRSHEFGFGRRGVHHQNIVAKYGAKNIAVYVFGCDSERQAFDDEVQQIAQFRKEGFELCNKTNGGEGTSGISPVWTPERRAKISAANKGRKQSPEVIAKRSASLKGRKMPTEFLGKLSLRSIGNKYGLGNKGPLGRKIPPEEMARRSLSLKEAWTRRVKRYHSLETRAKISTAKKNPSNETRERMSASAKARWVARANTFGQTERSHNG